MVTVNIITMSCAGLCTCACLHGPAGSLQVNDACFGRRIASAPADVMPRAVPHLHKIQPKDPIEAENQRYVNI